MITDQKHMYNVQDVRWQPSKHYNINYKTTGLPDPWAHKPHHHLGFEQSKLGSTFSHLGSTPEPTYELEMIAGDRSEHSGPGAECYP